MDESKSTDGHVAEKIWLFWFWMEPRMEITFLMQMLSQSVLSWMGESDQFIFAKSGQQVYWQWRMTGFV